MLAIDNNLDLNIFIPEQYEDGVTTLDPYSWRMHVYYVHSNGHKELDSAQQLTREEIDMLGLNTDDTFGVDTWYGMAGFIKNYNHKLSDRLKDYLASFYN